MTDIPNGYGEGMNAFERGPNNQRKLKIPISSEAAVPTLPSPEAFTAVSSALEHLGLDISQALTDPRVAALADNLFALAIDPGEFKGWNDKPKPKSNEQGEQ